MKPILWTVLLFTGVLIGAGEATAQQNRVGLHLGYNLDADEFFLGGQARFEPQSLPIIINPALETYFVEGATWIRIDVNALYPFGVDNTAYTPYAGAGLGLNFINPEFGDSVTDALLNLIFGANFGTGMLQPFAEARLDVGDGLGASIRAGLLVSI